MVGCYRTCSGRTIDLSTLTQVDRDWLRRTLEKYRKAKSWTGLLNWLLSLRRAGFDRCSPIYQIAEDLQHRLGIGKEDFVLPDYLDVLSDTITQRFGTPDAFCQATGLSPDDLNQVLDRQVNLPVQTLIRVLEALQLVLWARPREVVKAEILDDQIKTLEEASRT